MAQLKLVSDLITETRQRSDMQNTQFVTDGEITTYLDKAYRKLYNQMAAKFSAHFVSEANLVLDVGSTNTYSLPSDFYKLLGLDIVSNSRSYTLKPWSLNDRNRTVYEYMTTSIRYIIKGNKVVLKPDPKTSDVVKCFYIPSPATITGATQIDCYNGFDEYIVLDAAISCKQKEESDVSLLMAQKQEALDQIINVYGNNQDDGFPLTVTDINAVNDDIFFWRL